ncbi:MAG: hypothetical protein K2I61_01280, partial [Muribaculaceae bacterium]|nr:hypothetical protein [Muribaculaceae bacterium]
MAASAVFVIAGTQAPGAGAGGASITPPPPFPALPVPSNPNDSIMMPFPVQQTVPADYERLMEDQFAADLSTPSNIVTVPEYD